MSLNYVNTRTGSLNFNRFSNGNIYPITQLPHALASFSIQSSLDDQERWYNPLVNSFEGIRLTHQASPWIRDYGHLIIMPKTGAIDARNYERWTSIRDEIIEPDYMSGYLNKYNIKFELVPTHSGMMLNINYKYKNDEKRLLLISDDADISFELIDSYTIRGKTNACRHEKQTEIIEYFYLKSNKKFKSDINKNFISLTFSSQDIQISFSTSFISYDQAIINYERELKNKKFKQLTNNAEKIWNNKLNKIEIETDNKELKEMFYTALYRFSLFPRQFHEYNKDNKPFHFNANKGTIEPGYYYVDNGFWDTFRTNYPLLSIIEPDLYKKIILGYQNYFKENGWYPKWISPNEVLCMVGTLSEVVMSEAVIKEMVDEKTSLEILNSLIKNSTKPSNNPRYGRNNVLFYWKEGYLPFDKQDHSASETQDYAYSDYAIGLVAKKLNKPDIAQKFLNQAIRYRKLFCKREKFIRAKDSKGNFRKDYNHLEWGYDYIEGSAWQCAFGPLHDMEGLNKLYNGKLESKIDELLKTDPEFIADYYNGEIHEMSEMVNLDMGQIAISNQPSFHIPFIYAELGKPNKTKKLVNDLVLTQFSPTIDGYPGDEDNGSMSAWYIFSVMGFYPFNPASAKYVTFGPLVDKVKIKTDKGVITLTKNSFNKRNKISHFELLELAK